MTFYDQGPFWTTTSGNLSFKEIPINGKKISLEPSKLRNTPCVCSVTMVTCLGDGRVSKATSLYLDLLRFAAAALVFLNHLSSHVISGGFLWRIGGTGHDGVVIFFVLSGYVISAVTQTKETNLQSYAVSRLARLYSVLIPALFLTWIADSIGFAHNPNVYYASRETMPLARLGSAFLFLSNIWHFDFSLLSNAAYWSLPYEFWYYVIFACAIFLSGKARWIGCGLSALIAGPNILLMFPLWLTGVAAHRVGVHFSKQTSVIMFVLSALVIVVVLYSDSQALIERASTDDLPPSFSWVDFVTGFAVGMNIFSASRLEFALPAHSLIRFCAAFTFSLYLFHVPLLQLGAAFLPPTQGATERGLILFTSVSLFVVTIGTLTERLKKPLRLWLYSAAEYFRGPMRKIA